MIVSIWQRRKRTALRQAMRGYHRLRDAGRLGTIDDVCANLVATPLDIAPAQFSERFYGTAIGAAELATRQYLYLRQILYQLPQALLAQLGGRGKPLVFALPRCWQDMLAASGYSLARLRSSLLWFAWLLLYWGYGVVGICRLLALSAAAGISGRYKDVEAFSHFEYITEAQTPRPASDGRSFDVMTWYLRWTGRAPGVETLTYRVKPFRHGRGSPWVRTLETPFLPVLGLGGWFRFAGWSLGAITVAFVDILRRRWWHPLLLREAALARMATMVPVRALARDYLLNNSGWLYRPLWTYEAEKRGSRILFYHYSTNSAAFKRPDGYGPEHYTWAQTNWPLHIVWDDHQADFVRRAVGPVSTEVVGPIWFASSADDMVELGPSTIAVFDVQPFRASRSPALAVEFNYYTAETCAAFVRDVARACAEVGFNMAWKRKRSVGKMAHPLYRKMAADLDRTPSVRIVPGEQSAIRVIEQCCASISLPFTSTALLARQLGKPSCYYDPSGELQKDDRAAHDVPLLTGYNELTDWIRSLLDATPCPEINREHKLSL